jgi:serine/threonine protein phosphatase PrpC
MPEEIEFIPEEYIKEEKKPEKKTPPPPPGARKEAKGFHEKPVPPPLPFTKRERGTPPPPPPGRREVVPPPPSPFKPREKRVSPPAPQEEPEGVETIQEVTGKKLPPPEGIRMGAVPPPLKKRLEEIRMEAVPPPLPKLEVIGEEVEVIEEKGEKKFKLAGGIFTKESPKHPNEDTSILGKRNDFGGVFDGMGGEAVGEITSLEAAKTIKEQITNLPGDISAEEAITKIKDALFEANQQIRRLVEIHPEYKGTGCTASIAKVCESGRKIVIGQIGDSRIYRLREGKLERISPEDSHLEVLKNYGFIRDDQDVTQFVSIEEVNSFCAKKMGETVNLDEMNQLKLLQYVIEGEGQLKKARLAAENKPFDGKLTVADIRYVISKAIDGSGIEPHVFSLDTKEGDQYIITSDGIHDNLFNQEISKIAQQYQGKPQEMSEALVKASHLRMSEDHLRSKNDDATAVVISINKIEGAKKEEAKAA